MPSTKRCTNPDNLKPMVEYELETRASDYPFSDQRLDVHRVALDMARPCRHLANRVPREYRTSADQLLRSAGQTVLLIGEGANRCTASQKRQRYTHVRGEVGEVAACLELLAILRLASQVEVAELIHLVGQLVDAARPGLLGQERR